MVAMADRATKTATIFAPPDVCMAVALDYERYPEWAGDVKSARVAAVDEAGRATEVDFTASALGRTTSYTLYYDYGNLPDQMSWKLARGDIMESLDGSYTFTPSTTSPGATDVVYQLSIDVVVPLPGFVKRRAEVRILNTLVELKSRVEAVYAAQR
jgi:hypothetical protein